LLSLTIIIVDYAGSRYHYNSLFNVTLLLKIWLGFEFWFGASNTNCRGRFSRDDWQRIDITP